MSGTLECEGVFELHVPDGWSVRGVPGETYELVQASGDVTVNISVFTVAADADSAMSAAHLVVEFAAAAGATSDDLEVRLPEDHGHQRAFVHFSAQGRDWFAMVMTFDDVAVAASAEGPAGMTKALGAGERLVASIAPAPRATKRRWYSRR